MEGKHGCCDLLVPARMVHLVDQQALPPVVTQSSPPRALLPVELAEESKRARKHFQARERLVLLLPDGDIYRYGEELAPQSEQPSCETY